MQRALNWTESRKDRGLSVLNIGIMKRQDTIKFCKYRHFSETEITDNGVVLSAKNTHERRHSTSRTFQVRHLCLRNQLTIFERKQNHSLLLLLWSDGTKLTRKSVHYRILCVSLRELRDYLALYFNIFFFLLHLFFDANVTTTALLEDPQYLHALRNSLGKQAKWLTTCGTNTFCRYFTS
jgi:hypothetical protein